MNIFCVDKENAKLLTFLLSSGICWIAHAIFLDSVGYKCNLGPLSVVSGGFSWHNNRLTNTACFVSILFCSRIDGTLDGAVKKHRKQYHKVLKADPYFKEIAARSADNAHIKGKHPLLKDISLTEKSGKLPGFAMDVGDPNDMPADVGNERHGVTAELGAICLEDHSKQKAAMSIGPNSASGVVCPTDHGEPDEDCGKDVVGWERVLQIPQ